MEKPAAKPSLKYRLAIFVCTSILAIVLSSRSVADEVSPATLEVTIEQGKVAGSITGDLAVFKGIPYAEPPTGKLRWRAPRPPRPWDNVLSAKNYGPYCSQSKAPFPMPKDIEMSEDCLTLNVWAPAPNMGPPRAVMVWIHGGGFSWNSGALPRLDGTALALQDVVVVTFNYRLGAFGAFAHPEISARQRDEVLGNYHVMDWLAALRWVQKNISVFGGNPDNVTIFGESAGGIAVNHLMTMPAAKGLFHKAISQSAPIVLAGETKFFLRQSDGGDHSLEAFGSRVASQFGIDGATDVPSALRAIPADKIAGLSASTRTGWPVIDGTLITDDLPLLFERSNYKAVPYMAGHTSWEGVLMDALPGGDKQYKSVDQNILSEAYGNIDNEELARLFFEDANFLGPTRYIATRVSSNSNPAYLYYFSYVAKFLRPFLKGAPHASDINYVFNTLPAAITEYPMAEFLITDQDQAVSNLMGAYWTQFAKTGDPNGQGRVQWKPCNSDGCPTLELGKTTTLHSDLFSKRRVLHKSLMTQRINRLGQNAP